MVSSFIHHHSLKKLLQNLNTLSGPSLALPCPALLIPPRIQGFRESIRYQSRHTQDAEGGKLFLTRETDAFWRHYWATLCAGCVLCAQCSVREISIVTSYLHTTELLPDSRITEISLIFFFFSLTVNPMNFFSLIFFIAFVHRSFAGEKKTGKENQ